MVVELAYRLGKWWGALGVVGRVVAFAVAVAAVMYAAKLASSGAEEATRIEEARQRDATERESAAAEAKLAAEAAEQTQKKTELCITNIKALIEAARAGMKEKQPVIAIDQLEQCEGTMVDPVAIKLLGSARQTKIDMDRKQAAAYAAAEKKRKRSQGVTLGMSMQDVLDSSWGRPNHVNRTINRGGSHEQWVYDGGYLYFDDGVLTSVQN